MRYGFSRGRAVSSDLIAPHGEGVPRFTSMQIGFEKQMRNDRQPEHLVTDMPDDPSGHWAHPNKCTDKEKWVFVIDLIHRHRGEVREISGKWESVQAPFPEESHFHHAQFAWTVTASKALTTFTGKPGKTGGRRVEKRATAVGVKARTRGRGREMMTAVGVRWRITITSSASRMTGVR